MEPLWHLHRSGVENVEGGPYLLVANHQSVLDIPATLTLPITLRVMGKASLFRIPLMGHYMRFSRQIAVPALQSPRQAQRLHERITRQLEAGCSVLIFPEGTRTSDGSLGKFHKGAFRLAIDTGVPVLPVAIRGTEMILGKGLLWPYLWRNDAFLRVHPPIDPADFTTARKMANAAHRQIQASLVELDAARGVRIPWHLGRDAHRSFEAAP